MKLNTPRITTSSLEPITASKLIAEVALEQVSLSNADVASLQAKNLGFDEAVLEKVLFAEAKLEKLGLTDVALKACDFSATQCSESSVIRASFAGGRMTGVDFSRGVIKDVVFEDCKLDMANFRFAKLTRVRFINCMMTEVDFQGAELTEVEFQLSHLGKVEFGQCKVKKVDARSSLLLDIRGWQSLQGLIVDSAQLVAIAPQLALGLGLVVED